MTNTGEIRKKNQEGRKTMKKFVSVEKMSKKDKKAYYAKDRGNWCGSRPTVFADKSKYTKSTRSRMKAELRAAF